MNEWMNEWMNYLFSLRTFKVILVYWFLFIPGNSQISSGGSKRVVYIQGGIHAREWISPATMMYMANQVRYISHYQVGGSAGFTTGPVGPRPRPEIQGGPKSWEQKKKKRKKERKKEKEKKEKERNQKKRK